LCGMRIATFAASGRTGRPLVEQALAAGHKVRALVRDPLKFQIGDERLAVIWGNILNAVKVEETIAGTDAVLGALGQTKGCGSTGDVQTRGTENTENIVAAMKRHGVRRLVSLTGTGMRDLRDDPKLEDRAVTFLLGGCSPTLWRTGCAIRRS